MGYLIILKEKIRLAVNVQEFNVKLPIVGSDRDTDHSNLQYLLEFAPNHRQSLYHKSFKPTNYCFRSV